MLFTVCQYVGISKSKIYATTLFFVGFLVWLLVSVGNVWLLLSGVALGIVFYYFSFGFAGFWKHAILDRKTLGMRSHLVLLAVGGALFFPSLSLFPEFGYNIAGAVRPLGINVFIGAFIFGSGMALMGSCSSGTLKKMGSFDWLFYYVFLWMIIGGTLAASQMGFWLELPSLEPFSVATDIPWYLGLCLHLLVIFVLYRLLLKWEASRYEYIELLVFKGERGVVSSPLLLAATLVVILNYIILLVSHHPWAISWIFPKLGIIGIQELSLPIDWEFWEFSSQNESSLSKRVLDDSIVLTSLGMVIGVSLAFLGQT
ncbi:YeeE/YedE thiosulfate transporter family protein, partial [Hydrogenovibrio marinus]